MRAILTLLLVGAVCVSTTRAQELADGSGKAAYGASGLPEWCSPAAGGGYLYDMIAGFCPCDFDSYWDVTGGRSPADWAGECGYGYECHWWEARAEYLLWFSRGRNTPLLARTLTAIGRRDTYGDEPIGENARSGLRLTLERLLADGETSIGGRFWGLEDSTERFGASTPNTPTILQPYFDVTDNEFVNDIVASPGEFAGALDILSKNDLIGADAWLRRTLWIDDYCSFDLLAGYQFTRLDDSIQLTRTSLALAGSTEIPPGAIVVARDRFRTQNEFHGGTLGFAAEHRCKYWSFEILGKVGLGSMREAVEIRGASAATLSGNPIFVRSQGFLTQPSNIGDYERHRFAVAPELNANAILNLSPAWRLHIGYSLLYWSHVVLAGNQIDPRINLTQVSGPVVGPRLPEFRFNRTDYVVQGLNLGAEYRW
jgi:hypothetical protein